ncbi:MAG TPA: DUF4147 domain-containing protein [Blastocatellia bacterium]|nr:DUF4147 domain-containing protein [Blastocatellia bacterium]
MPSTSELRTVTQQIFFRTLAAIDVESVVRANLSLKDDQLEVGGERIELAGFKRILVIAIGKASLAMARAVEQILEDRVSEGLAVTNAVIGALPARLPVLIGGHPLPNAASLEAGSRALSLLHRFDAEETLIIFLISGGGSAIFEQPIDRGLTLEDLREVNRVLVGCGAVINEMNLVRRRLSAVKGGRLSAAAPRSTQVSLYLSDVNSDDLTTVASGPTLPDGSTHEDFLRVVARYDLLKKLPPQVSALIESGRIRSQQPANPGTGGSAETASPHRSHHLLLDNRQALAAARRIAETEFGLRVEIAEDLIEGQVEEMAQVHLERVRAWRQKHSGRAVCLLSGGEVICPVRGSGQGGRNQEFVLRSLMMLEKLAEPNLVVLSAGTDGIDGNSPADGAIAELTSLRRASELGLSATEHLENSDSFNFFNPLGDAVMTGPTGNNVRDLRILTAF